MTALLFYIRRQTRTLSLIWKTNVNYVTASPHPTTEYSSSCHVPVIILSSNMY